MDKFHPSDGNRQSCDTRIGKRVKQDSVTDCFDHGIRLPTAAAAAAAA
jgi:hypothetical protein